MKHKFMKHKVMQLCRGNYPGSLHLGSVAFIRKASPESHSFHG